MTHDEDLDPLSEKRTELQRESDRLRHVSNEILASLDAMRHLETEARKVAVGSPEFERISTEIAKRARDVFRMAGEQAVLASEYDPQTATIDDADEKAS